jgi:hypothetical protein
VGTIPTTGRPGDVIRHVSTRVHVFVFVFWLAWTCKKGHWIARSHVSLNNMLAHMFH